MWYEWRSCGQNGGREQRFEFRRALPARILHVRRGDGDLGHADVTLYGLLQSDKAAALRLLKCQGELAEEGDSPPLRTCSTVKQRITFSGARLSSTPRLPAASSLRVPG